jgi:Xaa-Pro aminopeptidase
MTTELHTHVSNKDRFLESANPELMVPFSFEEYRIRLDRIRAAMELAGLNVLYLSAPESICYVSGHQSTWYQGQAPSDWYPGSGIAIHVDSNEPIHFEYEDELTLTRVGCVSRNVKIRRHDDEAPTWVHFVVAELAASGWLSGRLGLEMWSSRPNRGYSELFQAALTAGGASVVDGTQVVRGVRNIKSAQELAYVRTAQKIADVGMRAAMNYLRPGVTELDVAAEVTYAMAKAGGESAGIPTVVASGSRSSVVHGLPSRRVITPGDIVNVDLHGVYNRYHAGMARCFSIGEPRAKVRDQVDKMVAGVGLVADLIRPSLPAHEFLQAVKSYYEEVGIWDDRWWVGGYELGIAFPPDTVGEFYYEFEREPGEKAFVPGIVCNYESNFYLPENAGLAVMTHTMAFTDESAEFLFGIPLKFEVVE